MFHTAKGSKLKAERRHFTPRKATYKIKRIQRTDLKTAWWLQYVYTRTKSIAHA